MDTEPLKPGDIVTAKLDPAWRMAPNSPACVLRNQAGIVTLMYEYVHSDGRKQYTSVQLYETKIPELKKAPELTEAALKQMMSTGESLRQATYACGVRSGTDPEIFVENVKGEVLPAWRFLESKKDAKLVLASHGFHTSRIFWDGFQAEFTPSPMSCLQQLMEGVRVGLTDVLLAAKKLDKTARLSHKSVVRVPMQTLMEETAEHVQFLCSPSNNVYSELQPQIPESRGHIFRYAGGHLHLGVGKLTDTPTIDNLMKKLDAIVGVAGVSLAANMDDPQRRKLYGRAGEFRLPEHGLEYRVLSNFWLCSPVIMQLVFMLARSATLFAMGPLAKFWEADEQHVQEVINSCNVQGARTILAHNLPVLTKLVESWSVSLATSNNRQALDKKALKTILGGLEVAVKEPTEIERNWSINKGVAWKEYGANIGGSWGTQQM